MDVADNQLASAKALALALGGGASRTLRLSPLRALVARGNPLLAQRDARLVVLHLLPELTSLDGAPADVPERVASHNLHGADTDELLAIRRDYFPDRLCTIELQQLPRLMQLYRGQYTEAFQQGKPLPADV